MFKESSDDLEDFIYRCPKCSRSFSAVQNLRDHLDIVHLHQPTRDTDEENFDESLYRTMGYTSKTPATRASGKNSHYSKDTLELERQLNRAKEMELRHQILHRHTKSQDELRVLNSEIHSARQRQYEMCNVIQSARGQIESLRETAEKVTADQHSLINKLKEELQVKDTYLDKSRAELRRLTEARLKQQVDIQEAAEETEKQRAALRELGRQIDNKESLITDKQKEITTLKQFISSATQKEISAREKLEQFVNSLLDRAENAETQLRGLRSFMAGNGMPLPEVPTAPVRNLPGPGPGPPLSGQPVHQRPMTGEAVMNTAYSNPRTNPQQYHPSSPPQRLHRQQPVQQPWQPSSAPTTRTLSPPEPFVPQRRPQEIPVRKLPMGPFPKSQDVYAFHGATNNPQLPIQAQYRQKYGSAPKHEQIQRLKGQGRDFDRPESGYSSLQHGYSRPHSQLSSVSEGSHYSIDTVVPVYEQEILREQGIVFSDDPEITSDISDSEVPQDLKVDDDGILWEEDSDVIFDSASLPSKNSSLTRNFRPKPSRKTSHRAQLAASSVNGVPSPLNLSRLSSINSTDKEILSGINKDTKLELQRYKFLLRDRLKMLREQEKIFKKDGCLSDDVMSDSELTAVTDDDSLTSLSVTSESDQEAYISRKKLTYAPVKVPSRKSDLSAAVHTPSSKSGSLQKTTAPPVDTLTQQRRGVLFLIFLYLDTPTRGQMALVCKEWRDVSRHPRLWRRVILAKARMSSSYLRTLAGWCTELQSLTLEELRARPKKSFETFEEYKKNTRGCLEEGLEVLLQAARNTLVSLRVVDCGNILTDRCLWLASCSCRLLERVAYISDTDPVGPEVMWSLGAGCRDVTTLLVPPLYPKKKTFRRNVVERAERFNNRCAQMISWCWPDLRILSLGGKHINIKGLVAIARNCSLLAVLELHRLSELTEAMSVTMCHAGLRHLEALEINYCAVTPGAIKHFAKSCSSLKTLGVRIAITDYFTDEKKSDNRKQYEKTVKQLQDLKKTSSIAKILNLQADSK